MKNRVTIFFVETKFGSLWIAGVVMERQAIIWKIQEKGVMGEYNITKIIDGLFIGDQIVALDIPFLTGNKIIRMLGWTVQPLRYNLQEDDIEQMVMAKNTNEVTFPSFQQLQQGFAFLQVFEQQMLCGLIYSESQLEASLICIMYLMRRFRWDCNTAHDFLRMKIGMFECSEQTINQLESYQHYLVSNNSSKLNHILWEYQFLVNYQTNSDDEAIIITTLRNKLRKNMMNEVCGKNKTKKVKRIKWQDQIRPSSAFSLSSVKRSSILKGKFTSPNKNFTVLTPSLQQEVPNKDLELLYKSVGFKNSNLQQKPSQKDIENIWEQCDLYQQLKEVSRTNFNDRFMPSKVRRRGSLKPKNTMQGQKNYSSSTNLQSIVGIYGAKSCKGLSKASSAQNFLTGLRSFNKNSLKVSDL